ncbi:MAG: M6 family metalloprotease domain-containing protein [bacterium]
MKGLSYDFLEPTGSRNLVVLLVKTKGSTPKISPEEVWSRFFGREDDDVLSVAEYYDHVSYGALHLEGTVTNWIELSRDMKYYAANRQGGRTRLFPRNLGGFVKEAVRKAYTSGAPIDNFDNQGDGHVDGLVVLYAGPLKTGEDARKRLWPRLDYVSVYGSEPVPMGSAVVDRFIVVPEYFKDPAEHVTWVYAHEVGHLFGLYDLYDKDKSSYGIGCTGLMGMPLPFAESWPIMGLTAFSKTLLGWTKPVTVTGNMSATLEPLDKSPKILKIPTEEKGEHFLLSYREPAGMDRHLYGNGLLLWRVNEHALYENKFECQGICQSGPLLSLVQADGKNDLERRMKAADGADFFVSPEVEVGTNTGASEDPFAGAHTLTYSGVPTGIRIRDIRIQDHQATVSIKTNDKAVLSPDYPYFKIVDREWTEIKGNGNGFPEKGELARLTLTVINLGKKARRVKVFAEAPDTYWYESSKRLKDINANERVSFSLKVRLASSNSFREAWDRMFKLNTFEKEKDKAGKSFAWLEPLIKISSAEPEIEVELRPRLGMGVPDIFMVNDSSYDLFPYSLRSLKKTKRSFLSWDVRERELPGKGRIAAPELVIWLAGTRTLNQGTYPGPTRTDLFRAVDEAGHSLLLSASRVGDEPPVALLDLFRLKELKPAAGFRYLRGYGDNPFSKGLTLRGDFPYYPSLTPHLKLEPETSEQRFLKDSRGNLTAAMNRQASGTGRPPSVFLGLPWESLPPPHGARLCKRLLNRKQKQDTTK